MTQDAYSACPHRSMLMVHDCVQAVPHASLSSVDSALRHTVLSPARICRSGRQQPGTPLIGMCKAPASRLTWAEEGCMQHWLIRSHRLHIVALVSQVLIVKQAVRLSHTQCIPSPDAHNVGALLGACLHKHPQPSVPVLPPSKHAHMDMCHHCHTPCRPQAVLGIVVTPGSPPLPLCRC